MKPPTYETAARLTDYINRAVMIFVVAWNAATLALFVTGWTHPGFTRAQANILSVGWLPPVLATTWLNLVMQKLAMAHVEAHGEALKHQIGLFVAGKMTAIMEDGGFQIVPTQDTPPEKLN